MEIISGFPGKYWMQFFVGGIYSDVLELTTDFPPSAVSIMI